MTEKMYGQDGEPKPETAAVLGLLNHWNPIHRVLMRRALFSRLEEAFTKIEFELRRKIAAVFPGRGWEGLIGCRDNSELGLTEKELNIIEKVVNEEGQRILSFRQDDASLPPPSPPTPDGFPFD